MRVAALPLAVALNLAASLLHYADNVWRFEKYPEPPWLNAPLVAALWFVLSGLGVLGLVLHRRRSRAARPVLVAYAILGFAGLGHYLAPMPGPMDWAMHGLIALEAVAALLLLVVCTREPRPRQQRTDQM